LHDLDYPNSGFPELANAIRRLPDFHADTEESRNAAKRISNLAIQSGDPQVKDAFEIMLRGGNSPFFHDTPVSGKAWLPYETPGYNAEIQALYWLGEQSEFKKDDTLVQAIAMSHGIFITLGDSEVRKAVYEDLGSFLRFMRNLNDYQETHNIAQLESFPLEAKLALAWRANDLGRFGRVFYGLGSNACPGAQRATLEPANIHNFYENRNRPISLKDYRFICLANDTLNEMSQYVMEHWKTGTGRGFADGTAQRIRGSTIAYGESWIYARPVKGRPPPPCENWVTIDGEVTRPTNINNPNYVWQLFKSTGKGYGVSDDFNAFYDALIKSVGIAGVAIDYIWGDVESDRGESHEETIYYDPSANRWKPSRFGPVSSNMDVFIFRPPAIQTNFFEFFIPDRRGDNYMRIPNLYHKMIGIDGAEFGTKLKKGIPSSEIYDWFFNPT